MTFYEAALRVLEAEGRPLHFSEITEARLNNGAAKVSASALAVHLGQVSGSEFGEQHRKLIPPFLGPMGAAPGLSRMVCAAWARLMGTSAMMSRPSRRKKRSGWT